METFAITDVFAAILVVALIILAVSAWRFVKEWAKDGEYKRFVGMVDAAVLWAEQTMQTKDGQEKLQQVLAQLQAAFPKLDVSFISIFVEKYVNDMKNGQKILESVSGKKGDKDAG